MSLSDNRNMNNKHIMFFMSNYIPISLSFFSTMCHFQTKMFLVVMSTFSWHACPPNLTLVAIKYEIFHPSYTSSINKI